LTSGQKQIGNYEKLRAWYLARLRKLAIASDHSLTSTPASLIAADRDRLQRRAAQGLQNNAVDLPSRLKSWRPGKLHLEQKIIVLILASLVLQLAFGACLFLAVSEKVGLRYDHAQSIVVASIIGNFAVAVSIVLLLKRLVIHRLRNLNESIQAVTSMELDSATVADEIGCTEYLLLKAVLTAQETQEGENAVADFALDIVCAFDEQFKISAVNPAVTKLWGYGRQELIGKELAYLVVGEYLESSKKAFESIRVRQQPGQIINQVHCNTGAIQDIHWSVEWAPEEKNWFCIARDITNEKAVERLRQHYVSMVSHDLRSPITSISVSLELLSNGAAGTLPAKAQEMIGVALRGTGRLINLINGILDAEKAETGSLAVFPKNVELSTILNASIESVQAFADKRAIGLECAPSPVVVSVDEARIVQVLVNLLSNAIKFSPSGSNVCISVKDMAGQVEIRITDAGRGVPKRLQKTIFERFKQVDASDARERAGSGLGLRIARMIVEAHGGSIGVESDEEQGSTFWLRLPKAIA
jgi:PAS domain S-box-containing protein